MSTIYIGVLHFYKMEIELLKKEIKVLGLTNLKRNKVKDV